MGKRLVAGWMAVVFAIGAAPTLSASGALAAAPVTAKLSIAGAPKVILGHEVVTVTGHLTPVRVGRTVTLQRASGKSWRTVGHTHTDAKGAYTVRTRAPLTGKERLRTLLVAIDKSKVVSAALTVVPVTPTISVSGVSWLRTGGTVRTSGTFSPARPGRPALLQRKAGRSWLTLARSRVDPAGRYAMNAVINLPAGAASLRVLVAPGGGVSPVASPVHVLTVVGPPPPLTGPFSAIYLGLSKGSSLGSYATLPGTPALDFTDDGRVTGVVPVDGPGLGVTATLPPSARTGTYAAHDGLVDIAWDTDGTTVTLRPDAVGRLSWNGVTYGAVDPLGGAHLSGTYRRLSGGSGARITFKGNGRFSDDGITADTNLAGTDNPSGTGSYTLRDNTAYLVYDSGPLETMSVYALPQYLGAKERIVLGGATLRVTS